MENVFPQGVGIVVILQTNFAQHWMIYVEFSSDFVKNVGVIVAQTGITKSFIA